MTKNVRHFVKRYCNSIDIKLVFSYFKIGKMFGVKDPISRGLRSGVVYKFSCAGCNNCYAGETMHPAFFYARTRAHVQ